jgi:4,5-dihydroxyphthalate decarboxylase
MSVLDDNRNVNLRGLRGIGKEAKPRTDLAVRIAFGDYDRTRPLMDGRVKIEGIEPSYFTEDIGAFCTRPVYEEFDVAEMSFSWFVAARDRGEPVIGFPIFPLRMPVFAYMFCRSDASYEKPSDLIGKRVGSMGYRYTVNLWLRGILKDHYGLSPEQVTWVTGEKEGAGYVVPAGIRVEVNAARTDEALLLAGEIDAIFSPIIPESFLNGDDRIRRLFPDAAAEQAAYFSKTGILPITHLMVASEAFVKSHPWAAGRLLDGFRAAQAIVDDHYFDAKNLSPPEAVFMLESCRRRYGQKLYKHGFEENRQTIETFVRYAHEQGYISVRPAIEQLFPAETLAL